MREPILKFVQRRLNTDFRDAWPQIAEDTGINYSTVYRIANDQTNPELDSIQKIIDWMEARDAMLASLSK